MLINHQLADPVPVLRSRLPHLPPCVVAVDCDEEGWLPQVSRCARRSHQSKVFVREDVLRRTLGRAGWAAWLLLLTHRNALTLECWLGCERLARTDPSGVPGLDVMPSASKLARGITRLRRCGLVESDPAIWYERHVGDGVMEYRHVRVVLGTRDEACRKVGGALVPARCARWLLAHPGTGWGGARKGAGRPSKMRNQDDSQTPRNPPAEVVAGDFKLRDNISSLPYVSDLLLPSSPSEKKGRAPGAPGDVASAPAEAVGQDALDDLLPGPTAPLDEACVVRADGLPPWPSSERTGTPRVPPAPRIPESAPDLKVAVLLVMAYWGAVRARFGCRAWTVFGRGGDLTKSKHYPLLVATGRLLREKDIAPAAWATWSVDSWVAMCESKRTERKNAGKKAGKLRPPPVAWTYSTERLIEREGWFCSESGAYSARRAVLLPEERVLGLKYLAVVSEPQERRAALLARLFPCGWATALEEVRMLNRVTQAQIDATVQRDGWVWLP